MTNITPFTTAPARDRWSKFVGQDESVDLLRKMDRLNKRTHVLLHGPPGTGKTTIAKILSRDNMIACVGTSLKNTERTATMIMAAIEQGIDTFFIDEVHSAKSNALEVLYPVMEEGMLYVGSAPIPAKIYIIAATTDGGKLPKPFVDRFGIEVRLRKYNSDEMNTIIKGMMDKFGLSLTSEMMNDIASRSLGIPRTARRIIARLVDFNSSYKDWTKYEEIIKLTGIDPDGLGSTERHVLKTIWTNFSRGPVGIRTIAHATGIDEYLIMKWVEPTLVSLGYLTIEKSGRKLTAQGVSRALTI